MQARAIAVIGAGQAGIPLAYNLKRIGHDVTLFSNRTPEQIRNGRIMSNQGIFDEALQLERQWGLNYWDKICPWNSAVTCIISAPGTAKKNVAWNGTLKKPFQSIDQRMKYSRWLNEFKQIGGNLIIQDVNAAELNKIAKWHELTIVAAGKGEISDLFPRNHARSIFHKPMRTLACMYVKGMTPTQDLPGVRSNIIPTIGEYFTMPGLTLNGACDMMLFESIPGSAFDCWSTTTHTAELIEISKVLLKQYLPWEAERCADIQLTDDQAVLIGSYTPIVKEGVIKMPCGKPVLGMADTVVLNDPIAGQGANSATKCADIYFNSIVARGKEPLDEVWMQATFETYWQRCAKAATQWSNMLLLPPLPHVMDLLDFASKTPAFADQLAEGFNDPNTLFPWIADAEQSKIFLEKFNTLRGPR